MAKKGRRPSTTSLIAPEIVNFLVTKNEEYNEHGVTIITERSVFHEELKAIIRQLPAPMGFDPDATDEHGFKKNRYRYNNCLYKARQVLEQMTPPITLKPDGTGRELYIGDSPEHTRLTQARRINTVDRITMRAVGILERSSMDHRIAADEANRMRMLKVRVQTISDQVHEAIAALEQA